MNYCKGSTINHLGGVVRNGKKNYVRRVAKKKSIQGASEKKIMFGQFNPKDFFTFFL